MRIILIIIIKLLSDLTIICLISIHLNPPPPESQQISLTIHNIIFIYSLSYLYSLTIRLLSTYNSQQDLYNSVNFTLFYPNSYNITRVLIISNLVQKLTDSDPLAQIIVKISLEISNISKRQIWYNSLMLDNRR